MNKQEGIKELESLKMIGTDARTTCYNKGINAGITIMEKLDEPQKPVVPTCAKPWLKQAQYSSDVIDLFSEVEYATDSDGFISKHWRWSPEFYDWLSEDTDTLYLLCDALRYGYKVEKEPLYEVVFLEDENDRYLLMELNEHCYEVASETENDGYRTQWFTESKIKSINKKFWPFAVPVEEEAE